MNFCKGSEKMWRKKLLLMGIVGNSTNIKEKSQKIGLSALFVATADGRPALDPTSGPGHRAVAIRAVVALHNNVGYVS